MKKWAVLVLVVFVCGVFAQEAVTFSDDDQKILMDNLGKLEDPKNAALAEKYLAKVDWSKMTPENQKVAESYLEKNIDRLEGDKLGVTNKYFAKITAGKFSLGSNMEKVAYKNGEISIGDYPNAPKLNLKKLPDNLQSATISNDNLDLTFKSYYTSEDTVDKYQKGDVKMQLNSGSVERNDPEKGMTLSKDATVTLSGGDMVIDGVHVSPGDGAVEKIASGWKITQAATGVTHEATIEIPGDKMGINSKVWMGFSPSEGQKELFVTTDLNAFEKSTNAVLIGAGDGMKNNLKVKGDASIAGFSEWGDYSFARYDYTNSKLDTKNIYDPSVKAPVPVTGLTLEGNGEKFEIDSEIAKTGNKIIPLREEPVREINDEEAKDKTNQGAQVVPAAARGLTRGEVKQPFAAKLAGSYAYNKGPITSNWLDGAGKLPNPYSTPEKAAEILGGEIVDSKRFKSTLYSIPYAREGTIGDSTAIESADNEGGTFVFTDENGIPTRTVSYEGEINDASWKNIYGVDKFGQPLHIGVVAMSKQAYARYASEYPNGFYILAETNEGQWMPFAVRDVGGKVKNDQLDFYVGNEDYNKLVEGSLPGKANLLPLQYYAGNKKYNSRPTNINKPDVNIKIVAGKAPNLLR